uniref:Fibronectin type-III domain-containing protein n=1 Tax=Parascaris univalens TaxID=6257 RepID=A0A915AE04_PARUN
MEMELSLPKPLSLHHPTPLLPIFAAFHFSSTTLLITSFHPEYSVKSVSLS